jgi:hypothetical protein
MPGPVGVSITGFNPTSLLSSGSYGLIWTQYKYSLANISGTGLTNSQGVVVSYPVPPANTTIKWEGQTANASSDGTSCTVQMQQVLQTNGPGGLTEGKGPARGGVGDTNTTVSVSIGNTNPVSASMAVILGLAPP